MLVHAELPQGGPPEKAGVESAPLSRFHKPPLPLCLLCVRLPQPSSQLRSATKKSTHRSCDCDKLVPVDHRHSGVLGIDFGVHSIAQIISPILWVSALFSRVPCFGGANVISRLQGSLGRGRFHPRKPHTTPIPTQQRGTQNVEPPHAHD